MKRGLRKQIVYEIGIISLLTNWTTQIWSFWFSCGSIHWARSGSSWISSDFNFGYSSLIALFQSVSTHWNSLSVYQYRMNIRQSIKMNSSFEIYIQIATMERYNFFAKAPLARWDKKSGLRFLNNRFFQVA